ncbi:MAG TPA: translocation/assembly module TamB domain-containing protein [Chitinophagaceae bacterium]|nr:translocation/assembly module TamB domain-containing protein [Chitinophagaceae bacterium]
MYFLFACSSLLLVLNLHKRFYCILLHLKAALKRFKKILKWFFLSLLFILVGLYIFIQTPFGQNWLARQVTKRLSRDLQTKISLKHVDFSLFNKMHLQGVLIEDQKGDTLLYAGDMKVRITDWFFFKKQAELKYVGLEDAIIKFQRTDSTWQQQFIFDYFASSDTTAKKKAGIKFDLKEVEMKNVTFLKKDGWTGQTMSIHVGTLNMNADKLSLSGNKFEINSLLLTDPVVVLNNYPGRKPVDTLSKGDTEDEIRKALSWNKAQTIVKIGNLKIINGTFKNDKQTERAPFSYFDGKHIFFTEINGDWSNASFIGDTVFSTMKLSAKERSGFELKGLSADMKMTPQGMFFRNMELVTNRSTLRNYFSMSYDDMSDMGDFIHKVKMAAIFEDSYVDSDDIAFFAPALKTWKKKITLRGKVRGTIDDMYGQGMLVQTGSGTLLNGDISLTGLPDINQTFIDFKANDFRTTYADAVSIVPAMRSVTVPNLRKIRYVNFRGNFTGFIRDFVTFGTLQTNLGTVTTDLNMKLPRGQDAVYSGKIATDNFRLGEFLDDKTLGNISLTATIKGRGFNDKSRNTAIKGIVRYVDFNKYRYNNISIDGRLDKKMFEGVASIKDPNADLTLNGIIDFNQKTPRFKLFADIAKADLRNLGILKDTVEFRGKADLDFTSNSIDNFLGTARITEAAITKNGHPLSFDSLIVSADYIDGIKTLTAVSNEFKAKVSGNFNLADLPLSVTYLLNKYYPAYVKAPRRYPKDQDINFDIETYYVDEYLQLIDPSLVGFNNSIIKGNLNLARDELNLTADVPQFKYKGYNFDNVKLTATGRGDSLVLSGQTSTVRINDSLSIPQAIFRVSSRNDSSKVSILTGTNQQVEQANLNALVLTYHDGVKIEFDPSTFVVNGKTWTIDESGELVFRSNTPASGLLVLSDGQQKISLRTQQSTKGNWNDIKAELTDVNLGDFAPFFMPKNRLEGLVSGTVMIEDPTNNLRIVSDDLQTKFLRLDNDSLGEVKASLVYDNKTKELKVKGNTLNQENYLGFDASIFFNDQAKNNIIALEAKNFQISILERFLGNLFSDIQGYLTGNVAVSGKFDNLNVTGKGRLKDAGLRVKFTQVFYRIQDTDIELTTKEINLDGLVLTDTITGNPVYLTGGIEHESFKNMFYNLDISTRKPGTSGNNNNKPVQLLNTTFKDNQQFYGNVKGTGSLSLLGPQSDMFMKIDAVASETDSSFVTLPPSSGRETGIADFLVERKYGREMTASDIQVGNTRITYDVDININKTPTPMVSVRVILDELTGDEIKGKGYGSLNIRSGTVEPLTLRGRFDIEEGNYLFTFQSFFKKPFELRKETENYIEWNGDPLNANIKFEAVYRAERVSFAPLGFLLGTSGASTARGDVYVVAKLSEQLFRPKIDFSLDFPRTSAAVTDPELQLALQRMLKDPNEVNRQVTYLIVFNSFAPSEQSGTTNYSVASLGLTTISGIFLNVINDQVNKILSNLFKSDKYNISLSTAIYNRGGIIDLNNNSKLELGSNINFTIGRSFFNNRFIVSTGVGYDAPIQSASSQQAFSQQLLPDVTLEWLINETGSIRASFFYRENTDYLTTANAGGPGKAKRIGANVSYRKDFDSIGDIFRRKKKKPEPQPVPAPPAGN